VDRRLAVGWADHVPPRASERALDVAIERVCQVLLPGRMLLTGTDSVGVATLSTHAIRRGWQVVFPAGERDLGRWDPSTFSLRVVLDVDRQVIEPGSLPRREGAWDVAMSTSGTTARPRTYGFTLEQISGVAQRYHAVYHLDPAAHVVTALPAAHNFAFVAGVCVTVDAGASVVFARRHDEVLRWLRYHGARGRVVVLASPVLLEHQGLERVECADLLVDSGAAPVSRPYLMRLREAGIDVREGYGTTETLSLTHFDTDGSTDSAGTVGYPVPGVECHINDDAVWVRSPFTGTPLDNALQPETPNSAGTGWIRTGDLGMLDRAGRLRLVGRVGDTRPAGRWPRDILDDLGDLLGARTASIRCTGDRVEIHLVSALSPSERSAIEDRVVRTTGMPPHSVMITDSHHRLTYSLKLPRTTAPSN